MFVESCQHGRKMRPLRGGVLTANDSLLTGGAKARVSAGGGPSSQEWQGGHVRIR